MDRSTAQTMSYSVAGFGLAITALVFFSSGPAAGLSAAIGAGIAVANWYLLRWMVGKVVDGASERSKAGVMFLAMFKMGALMALSAVLMLREVVTPIAFGLGLSALVCGILFHSFMYIAGGRVGSQR